MAILSATGIADILVHVGFMAGMVGIFYFLYIPIIEKKVVKDQVNDVIGSLADDIKGVVPEDILKDVQPLVKKYLVAPDLSAADKKAKENNDKIKKTAIIYLGGLIALIAAVVFGLWMVYKVDIVDILIENTILLVVVAITYFSFVTFIAANFKSADPNAVKLAIVNSFISI